ncbi:MAG: hypothetical protein AAF391_05070 [Bacteroidota bacterium]
MSRARDEKKIARQVANAAPANRIEKFRQYLFQSDIDLLDHDPEIILSPDENKILNRLQMTFNLLIDNSVEETEKTIRRAFDIGMRQARNYIIRAKELFGEHIDDNKQAARAIQVMRREKEIAAIRKDKRIDAISKKYLINKHFENIEKIKGLDREDSLSISELIDSLTIPVPIRSTDPIALQSQDAQIVE